MTENWFHPRGSLARDGWQTVVDGSLPGWQHTGLRVGDAGTYALPGDGVERMIVPLDAMAVVIEHAGGRVELVGRASVFDGPADVAYLGIGTAATITSDGRFAVAEAPATERLPVGVLRAGEIPVELRGAGSSTRQVHNFGTPGALAAQKLIVCEVITPSGNWSSYPPHKHDTDVPGHESRLEEIYWFEASIAGGPSSASGTGVTSVPEVLEGAASNDPFGMFAAYSSPGHGIELDARVHTGDVALIPHGYHGPAAAAPGYDLYYLNVMAGPDRDRVWNITDDPAHAWVRSTWNDEHPDPRLPYRKANR
ncbi:MAG: iolB [Microbacteriaceae bacterium]|nr:iolB [Microbacteriaceae bacterium]